MAHFTPSHYSFLRQLAKNNDRAWFKSHQDEYERFVRQPALEFISTVAPLLDSISPYFRADASKVGGSLMRIHRDMRFSKDGAPYKTNTGIQFRHRSGADVHAHGFYLNLEPAQSFLGVGVYQPATAVAYDIRKAIDSEPDRWRQVTTEPPFTDDFELIGHSLVKPPRGYTEDHPLLADLKRKDFIAMATLTQAEVTSHDFADRFVERCRSAAPFMRFLCEAVALPF